MIGKRRIFENFRDPFLILPKTNVRSDNSCLRLCLSNAYDDNSESSEVRSLAPKSYAVTGMRCILFSSCCEEHMCRFNDGIQFQGVQVCATVMCATVCLCVYVSGRPNVSYCNVCYCNMCYCMLMCVCFRVSKCVLL